MKTAKLYIMIISMVILSSSCGNNPVELKKPEFPQMALALDIDKAELDIQLTDTALESELPVYRVSNTEMSESKVNRLLSVFGFTDPMVAVGKDLANRTKITYTEDYKKLCIINDGHFVYTGRQEHEDIPVSLSDEEVKKQAEKFLRDNDLLPEGFSVGGVGYSEVRSSVDPKPIIYEKCVGFFRRIDGYDVCGRSDILVTYDEQGIVDVYSVYNNYELDCVMECKTLEEAQAEILSSDSWISCNAKEFGRAKKIQITECEIVYYDKANTASGFIQPCITFIGTIIDEKGNSTEFSSTVPALKEECYK